MAKPRDGPALQFCEDPYVKTLLSIDKNGCPNFENSGSKFGLVLVLGWQQFSTVLGKEYNEFKKNVAQCFDPIDTAVTPSNGQTPAVYLYPVDDLHITISAFHYFHPVIDLNHEKQLILCWGEIVDSASKRKSWPSLNSFSFRPIGTQIGKRNGILLWKETSGGVDAMRKCISEEIVENHKFLVQALGNKFQETLSIPGIIHSTFSRFHRILKHISDSLQTFFPQKYSH